jgi:6-phosphogluconolactonase
MKIPREFLFVLLTCIALNARAAEDFFYITGTNGIYRDSIDTETGKLGTLVVASPTKNTNFLALSQDDKFLYATLNNAVASFAVGADGSLKELNEQPSGGEGPCHVSLDGTGRDIFVSNYQGGCLACLQLKPDGTVGERTALIPFTGSGPDVKRQMKPHSHAAYTDPKNKFVYACDLGTDHVWIFKLDASQGTLTPANPPFASVPPGSGPRHLAFYRDGQIVYVASEMGHTVTAFNRDAASGALTAFQNISTLPPGTSPEGVTTAEIVCHPSGNWLYVSNRGCDTMSVFSIRPNGSLNLIESVSSVAHFPRNFTLDPTGKWLIAAGQKDNRFAVLKIDPATGWLTATDQAASVPNPMCVLFSTGNK